MKQRQNISTIFYNEAHAIPVDKNGTATFTGSGITIRLFEVGDTELDYDGSGTANGRWTVADPTDRHERNKCFFSFTESGNQVIVSAITAMSAATGNRSFAITGKRSDGTAISLSKVQSFVKTVDGDDGDPGANAPVVHTSASHVNFNKDGSTYDPAGTSTILLEAGPNTTITSASFAASPSSYITISNSSTSGCTATFSANRTAAQINGNNKVTADLTGTITKADGTTVTGVRFW